VSLKRIIRCLVVAGLLVLPLASCNVLFMGSFPSDAAQTTARIDLSSEISALAAPGFSLSILRSGMTEYVLLFSDSGFDGSQPHLFVLSPGLAEENRFTMNDIVAVPPVGIQLQGNAAVTQLSSGNIVVGNLLMSPATAGLNPVSKLEPPVNLLSVELRNGAIVGPSSARFTWTDFSSDSSGTMSFRQFANDWGSATSWSHPIGRTCYLRDVFTDPEDDQVNTALLVFEDPSPGKFYFLSVPKDPDMTNGFAGPALFDNPAYSSFTMNNLDSFRLSVVSDGIVAYDHSSQSLIWFTAATASSPVSLHLPNKSGSLSLAFSFSGGYYCVWDSASRILTRYEKWW